jgi:hypothetical protein
VAWSIIVVEPALSWLHALRRSGPQAAVAAAMRSQD